MASRIITEAELLATVVDMARALGWLVHHTHDSRRSESGVPDLLMVNNQHMGRPRVIFAELKSEGAKLTRGRTSPKTGRWLPGQREWLSALDRCVNVRVALVNGKTELIVPAAPSPVEVYIWYPWDLDMIERILTVQGSGLIVPRPTGTGGS